MRRPWETHADHHARLAQRAADGDRAAFVALYRALYPPVARWVGRRAASAGDAEDVVSLTFHRLLEALPRLDPARGTPLAFALGVARHALADEARRRAVRAEGPAPEVEGAAALASTAPGAERLLLERERLEGLARLLDGLPAEVRELLELRFGDGLRHAEIAALTGASEAAVRQRLSRALRALRAAARAAGEVTG